MKKYILVLIVGFITQLSFAQNGYDWGDNKPEAQGNWVYMNNLIKEKQYTKAKVPTVWLLQHTPNLHVDLYKQAIKVYEKVEKLEEDPQIKTGIQDTVLMMYDLRISKFNDKEANVLNRKGLVAYKYLYKRKERWTELYDLYAKIVVLNGSKTYSSNVLSYMKIACKKKGDLSDEQVLDVYDKGNEILDAQMVNADAKKIASNTKIKEELDKKLLTCVNIDCDFVIQNFGPKFKENPSDIKLAKRIWSLMRTNKCISNDLYLEAADVVLAEDPTVSGYKEKGNVLKKLKRYDDAIIAYEKAISLSEDDVVNAELYLKIAKMYSSKGQKSNARSYAKKVIAIGEKVPDAYLLIGDLYMYSAEDCRTDDILVQRSIYIAAYNKYTKAGNTARMVEAKKNFPSMEEIFVRNKKVGDDISTGCWINETVQLQKR